MFYLDNVIVFNCWYQHDCWIKVDHYKLVESIHSTKCPCELETLVLSHIETFKQKTKFYRIFQKTRSGTSKASSPNSSFCVAHLECVNLKKGQLQVNCMQIGRQVCDLLELLS